MPIFTAMTLPAVRLFWGTVMLMSLSLSGCRRGLDDDSLYVNEWKATFIRYQQPNATIGKLSNTGNWNPNWLGSILSGRNLTGNIAITGHYLWLCADNELVIVDLRSDEISEKYTFSDVRIKEFAVGNQCVLLLDSVNRKLAVAIRRSDTKLKFEGKIDLPIAPVSAGYAKNRFFVTMADSSIWVYNENAVAVTDTLRFPGFFLVDRHVSTYSNMNLTFQKAADLNYYMTVFNGSNGTFSNPYRLENIIKVRASPITQIKTETEYLGTVQLLTNGKLNPAIIPDSVSNFEIDFVFSRLYYQKADSCYQFQIGTRAITARFLLPGRWQQIEFYHDWKGR
jgi:hypothetical protein